jgi:glycerate kinase
MRVLIAPNPFKHCLSGPEVAAALGRGFRRAGWDVDLLPLADGGPGTLDALRAALGGERHHTRVADALGKPVRAAWLQLGSLAVIESAEAIGLERLGQRRQPLRASTEGLGQLLLDAQKAGCKEAWVGLGGSASTDGGTGMARVLGWRFLDDRDKDLGPGGAALGTLAAILRPVKKRLTLKVRGLCDVRNPLLGIQGAAKVYGPQKGANAVQVQLLETGLRRLAALHAPHQARLAGAGAAGGLGFGLMAFAGGQLRPGAATLLQKTQFLRRLKKADLVVTGEGRLDAQTLHGKLPAQVLAAAKATGKPCLMVAGALEGSPLLWRRRGALAVEVLQTAGHTRSASLKHAAPRLQALAYGWCLRQNH